MTRSYTRTAPLPGAGTKLLLTLPAATLEALDRHRTEVKDSSGYEPSRQAVIERALAEYLAGRLQ